MPQSDYSFENLQNLYAAYAAQQQQARQQYASRLEDLLGGLGGWQANGQRLGGNPYQNLFNQAPPKWSNLAEMNAALAAQRAARPKPKVIDKAARILEIEKELDIIRGRVPTPKGYKVDATKVKDLMIELRSLKNGG